MTRPATLPSYRRSQPDTGLVALVPIETVDETITETIVPRTICHGPLSEDEEFMSRRVDWANRATFTILDCKVPGALAPYNAVIRISAAGTEDLHRDYLAVLTR